MYDYKEKDDWKGVHKAARGDRGNHLDKPNDRDGYPKKSAPTPSGLHIWYHKEFKKREAGKNNELDQAELHGTIIGVLNSWSDVYKKYPGLVKKFVESQCRGQEIWQQLVELKNKLR